MNTTKMDTEQFAHDSMSQSDRRGSASATLPSLKVVGRRKGGKGFAFRSFKSFVDSEQYESVYDSWTRDDSTYYSLGVAEELDRSHVKGVRDRALHFPSQRELNVLDLDTFVTREFNQDRNTRSLGDLLTKKKKVVSLKGVTFLGGYKAAFPVKCSAFRYRKFLRYLDECEPDVRRDLWLDGLLTDRVLKDNLDVFGVSYNKKLPLLEFPYIKSLFLGVFIWFTWFIFGYYPEGKALLNHSAYLMTMCSIYDLFEFKKDVFMNIGCSTLTPDDYWTVMDMYFGIFFYYFSGISPMMMNILIEELFKVYFDYIAGFLLCFFEMIIIFKQRQRYASISCIIVPLFHITSLSTSLFVRIWLHVLWNAFISEYLRMPLLSLSDHLEKCEDACFILSVVRQLYYKDYVGLVLSVGQRATYFESLYKLLTTDDYEISDVDTLVSAMALEDAQLTEHGTILLGPSVARSVLEEFAPEGVSKSPTVNKIMALCLVLVSASFVNDSYLVKLFSKYIDWSTVESVGDVFAIAVSAIKSITRGVLKFAETGSWRDFFEMPGYVKFIDESSRLLMAVDKPETNDEILMKIAKAQDLIDSQMYKTSTPDSSRLVQKLRDFVVEKGRYIDAQKTRLQPQAIWLNGEPGFGKTVVIDSMINNLSKLNNWDRFVGDVINLDINDKYPVSAGAHPRARFLVLNDIPSIYTNFPKEDKLSIEILLQKIFDTYPLYFRAAAVEDKGKLLNHIAYVIFTSNHDTFVCCGETEKLQRRLESGVLVNCTLQENGRIIPFSKTLSMSQGERNAAMKMNVQQVKCSGKFIQFVSTDVNMSMRDFWAYLKIKSDSHLEMARTSFEKFGNAKSMCSCGVAKALHYVKKGSLDVPEELGPKCYIDGVSSLSAERSSLLQGDFVLNDAVYYGFVLSVAYVFCSYLFLFCNHTIERIAATYIDKIDSFLSRNPFFFRIVEKISSMQPGHEARMMMFRFHRFHIKAKLFVRRNRNFIMLAGSAAFFSIAYKYIVSGKAETLGKPIFSHQVETESMKVTDFVKKVNYESSDARKWNKNVEDLSFIKVQTVNVSGENLSSLVRKQVLPGFMDFGDKGLNVVVFILNCEHLLINRHFVEHSPGNIKSFTLKVLDKIYAYDVRDIIFTEHEFVMLKNYFMPQAVPLQKFLLSDFKYPNIDVTVINPDWTLDAIASPDTFVSSADGKTYKSLCWKQNVEKGICGSVIIGRVNGSSFILGIVSYGKKGFFGSVVGGCVFTASEYDAMCKKCMYPQVDAHLLAYGYTTGELSSRSELRSVNTPFLSPVGTLPGACNSFHSKIKKSRFYDDYSKFMSCKFEPPKKLRGLIDKDNWSSCFMTTFKNINLPNHSTEVLREKAMRQYLHDCTLDVKGSDLRPLNLDEAIFGFDDMNISRVEFNTSVGRTMRELGAKNKYDLFEEVGDELYRLRADFKDKVSSLIDQLKRGLVPVPYVDFSPKDEVRPVEKIEAYKIRLFSVLDFHYNIVFRMFYMPLITYLLDRPFMSECFGQMNAGSKQWNELALYLLSAGGKVFDMDFSTFDMSHDDPFFEITARFFYLLSKKLGYSDEWADVVYYLGVSLKMQLLIYMNDVGLKFKGMPSGVIITLILNSVINSIMMRMAFCVLVGEDRLPEFKDLVKPATVGDDNGSGVSDSIFEKFNMTTIAPLYKTWGYVATPASKSGAFQKVMNLEELVFVKRRFVKGEFGYYMAPLELNSIYKALCFESEDMGVPAVQRLVDVSQGCQREAFLHGQAFFDAFVVEMKSVFEKHQMGMMFKELSYDVLKDEFLNGSFKTFAC